MITENELNNYKGIPFSLSMMSEPFVLGAMDEGTFDAMMEKGYQQAINGETAPVREAFDEIRKKL